MHSNLFQNDHILSIYIPRLTDPFSINVMKEKRERKRGKISLIRLSNSVTY